MFIPGALHGIEASLLASSSLHKLPSLWSFGHTDSLWPMSGLFFVCCVTLHIALYGSGSVCYGGTLLIALGRLAGVCRLLGMVPEGCPGHGPIHFLASSAADVGFQWDPPLLSWARPGLRASSNLVGPMQHFNAAVFFVPGKVRLQLICVLGVGFVVGHFLTLQRLNSGHIRERDEAGFGMGSFCDVLKDSLCHAGSVVVLMVMVTSSAPLVEIRENPEFHDLMRMDKGHWPRCLLWHGWLPLLSGTNAVSPWAGTAAQGPVICWNALLDLYSARLPFEWEVPPQLREGEWVVDTPDAPNAMTDGSLVQDKVSGASSSGSFFFAQLPSLQWDIAGGVIWMTSGLMMVLFSHVGVSRLRRRDGESVQ